MKMAEDGDVDQNIVEAIKYEYYKQLGRTPSKVNVQLDTAARKAAGICYQVDCDPAVYVAAQIKHWVPIKSGMPFVPAQLASKNAIGNINSFRSVVNHGNTWKGLYTQQKRYLSQAIKNTDRTIEEILLDSSIGFNPWFRCLVTKQPIPSIIKKWGGKAHDELKSDELRTFLNDLQLIEHVTFDYSRIPRFQ